VPLFPQDCESGSRQSVFRPISTPPSLRDAAKLSTADVRREVKPLQEIERENQLVTIVDRLKDIHLGSGQVPSILHSATNGGSSVANRTEGIPS
jgi:hypothetical protein